MWEGEDMKILRHPWKNVTKACVAWDSHTLEMQAQLGFSLLRVVYYEHLLRKLILKCQFRPYEQIDNYGT